MDELLQVSTNFPTVIFSVVLGVVAVYWIVGLLGLVDLDFSGDVDADIDADGSIGGLSGFMLTFGLSGIPFTLVISIVTLVCWLISFYTQYYVLDLLPSGWLYFGAGAIANVVIFFISLPIAAIMLRPFKSMFATAETASSAKFVGLEATISTSSVTPTFGQAKVFNDGAEILLDVRCVEDQLFKRGDKVLLIEYHAESHAYIVAHYAM